MSDASGRPIVFCKGCGQHGGAIWLKTKATGRYDDGPYCWDCSEPKMPPRLRARVFARLAVLALFTPEDQAYVAAYMQKARPLEDSP